MTIVIGSHLDIMANTRGIFVPNKKMSIQPKIYTNTKKNLDIFLLNERLFEKKYGKNDILCQWEKAI